MKKLIIFIFSSIIITSTFAYTQTEFETRFNYLDSKDTDYKNEFFTLLDNFKNLTNNKEKDQSYVKSIYLNCKIYLNTTIMKNLIDTYPDYYEKQFDAQTRKKHQIGMQSRLDFNQFYFQQLQHSVSDCSDFFGIYPD